MQAALERIWWRLVRLGFRLLYNELAFTYDIVSKVVSLGAWRCWQRSVLDHLGASNDVTVLELAHGTGDLQLDLHSAGYRSIGYDLSPHMGRIAHNKLIQHQVPANLVRGYAQQLPFPNDVFSNVVCTFPTAFIVNPQTLMEVYRVLQPDGRIVVVPSGILTGQGAMKSFLEWLYEITGQREGDMSVFAAAFIEAGFEVEIIEKTCSHSVAIVVVAHKRKIRLDSA